MAEDMLDESDDPVSEGDRVRAKERLRKTLLRMSRDGYVIKEGATRSTRWRLK